VHTVGKRDFQAAAIFGTDRDCALSSADVASAAPATTTTSGVAGTVVSTNYAGQSAFSDA